MSASVAVAIIHHRSPDSVEERISLRHAERWFRDYDVYAVTPSGVRLGGYPRMVFADRYFASLQHNNHLRLLPEFYERFGRYDYLLVYELDSLVFSGDLGAFCTGDHDYLGAPWVRYDADNRPVGFDGVGNSGFSLRRVQACLNVLTSDVRDMHPAEYWRKIGREKPGWLKLIGVVGAASKALGYRNDVSWFVRQFIYSTQRTWSPHEDKFWRLYAPRFDPEFRIAPVEQALRFSFEHAPSFCFAANGGRLPLGCHAWFKHDNAFWQPYLLG